MASSVEYLSNSPKAKYMSRMNKRTRDRLYPILAKRDGEECSICGCIGNASSLVIDHFDNNNRNNELENLQLLCRKCNAIKNSRGKGKRKTLVDVAQHITTSREIILNEKYEPMFRKYLEKKCSEEFPVELKDLIASGAEITDASQTTIIRYIDKMCSSAGRFQIIDEDGIKYVEFKTWFNPKP